MIGKNGFKKSIEFFVSESTNKLTMSRFCVNQNTFNQLRSSWDRDEMGLYRYACKKIAIIATTVCDATTAPPCYGFF